MQALDDKLVDQLAAVRAEIAQVETAEPLIDAVVAVKLTDLEETAARFQAAPFAVTGGDIRAATPAGVRNMVLGAMATFMPAATRELIEAHTREVEQQRKVLRLAPEAKAAKLAQLRDKAQRLEARLELQRRELERDPDTPTFVRAGYDPAIWLADDVELQTMVASTGRAK